MNALKGIFYVVAFQFCALALFGNWGWLGLPTLIIAGVGVGFYRAYKLEILRREMAEAQEAADAAAENARLAEEDLRRAEDELAAARAAKESVRQALRTRDWLAASTDVSVN